MKIQRLSSYKNIYAARHYEPNLWEPLSMQPFDIITSFRLSDFFVDFLFLAQPLLFKVSTTAKETETSYNSKGRQKEVSA
jgi:hypothetical protein